MVPSNFDASELYDFLEQVEGRRSCDFYQLTAEGGPFVPASGPYYASQIMLSEPRAPSLRTERDVMSLASSATPRSAMFDAGFNSYSEYSRSTAPPSRGHGPPRQQRPSVPNAPVSWLPCEFRELSLCSTGFALDDVEPWIEHIIAEHLNWDFPRHCICWFCDHEFQAASELQEDKEKAYRRRMHHIAQHFQNGKTTFDIRPDFHFLNHAYDHYLIQEDVFQREKGKSELLPPRDMIFANHPHPWVGSLQAEEYGQRLTAGARRRDGPRPLRARRAAE
ncbi:hypothetical protein TOPH_02702 [Tolypocladium ophioglossoides CBS 100239]|uniref:Uncharacterized protein n=1 Tax=Tolypocladium ophioglossoides (strain CBS 100239) TaxID=1163406 RepID=A0A0L0NF43_TOLOC|nr:hypothetical protein TOPH_02702 [Tolypocladium ophioglossoides CBS 100239]